jgi:GxxExxY protein
MQLLHEELTEIIIKAYYNVYNELGYGFLERVYENALIIELEELGLSAKSQHQIKVLYKGRVVGDYFADVLVGSDPSIIVELKATSGIVKDHELQLQNYLKATGTEVGLLLNFGPKPEFIRRVFSANK